MQENRETEIKRNQAGRSLKNVGEFFREMLFGTEDANERLIGIISGIAFGLMSYFFGKCDMLFGTFPLGIALLSGAERHVPYIFIGLLFSIGETGLNKFVCIAIFIIMIALRIMLKLAFESEWVRSDEKKKTKKDTKTGLSSSVAAIFYKKYRELFTESVYLRMANAAFGAFCLSLYAIVVGGFRYYDLFGLFFSLVISPVACFIFSTYFDKSLKGTKLHDVSVLMMLVALSYATREFTFFGVYVGAFVTFFATLCICRRRGILAACVSGLLMGLAFDPIYAPLFILEGAAAGVLWNVSTLAAATAGCVVGIIWGVYVNGFEALSRLLPALLCGAMVFGAADRLALITSNPELIRIRNDEKNALEALVKGEINRSDENAVKRLSVMFSSLAQSFYNISDRMRRPGALDLRRTCDTVFDKYCESCPKREACWGTEYSETLDDLKHLSSELHVKARADISVCSESLRERCDVLPQIINDINESCARLTEHALMCDRTGVFALDYDGISHILDEALESGRQDYVIDEKTAQKVGEVLKKLRFSYTGVIAYGGRRKSVAVKGLDASRSRVSIKELRSHIEKAVGQAMGEVVFVPSGSRFDMTVSSRRAYSAKEHTYSLPSNASGENGRVCGDSTVSFENGADYYYSLISDGMGAGKEAALSSRICSMFLEKMLGANNKSETSLRLLNSFMSEKDATARYECSATIDLFELDLIGGKASILKSGASPSFVKRGNECIRLSARTLPLGIIDTPDAERLNFDVEDGDFVIMVSDGVVQSLDDCPWLVRMIRSDSGNADELCKKIAHTARANGSTDDITVNIVKIEKI